MRPFLYKFFHTKTNDRSENGLVAIPKDPSEWPESWKTIAYKNYFSFKPVKLGSVFLSSFKELLNSRHSTQDFRANDISLEKLSYLLWCGYGLQDSLPDSERAEHRTVPSAGKRYPLEIYVFLFRAMGSLEGGAYHYSVKNHELEPVVFREFSEEEIADLTKQENLHHSNGIFCITSVFNRVTDKYGSRGYRYILQESGHVAQNILLAGTEQGIAITPVGGATESFLESIIGLHADEQVVYTLFF